MKLKTSVYLVFNFIQLTWINWKPHCFLLLFKQQATSKTPTLKISNLICFLSFKHVLFQQNYGCYTSTAPENAHLFLLTTTSLKYISQLQFFSSSQLESITKARQVNVNRYLIQFQWIHPFPTNIHIIGQPEGFYLASVDQRKYNHLDVM